MTANPKTMKDIVDQQAKKASPEVTKPRQPLVKTASRSHLTRAEAAVEITRLRAELAKARESAKSAWGQWDALQDLLGASKEVGFAFDEVARLKAQAQSAHAVGFAAGIEAAASAVQAYEVECAKFQSECGAIVNAFDSLTYASSAIRALTPPDIAAAAARVLIPVFEGKHRDYMLSKGRNPDDYSSHFSMAVIDLRALAEVKP